MAKVYVVTTGSYSDYSIRAIFAKKEHAELLAARIEDSNGVAEWELAKLKETKPLWLVWFYDHATPEASQNSFAIHGEVKEYEPHPSYASKLCQQIGCRAADEQTAIKVASDIRAEYLDKKLNP